MDYDKVVVFGLQAFLKRYLSNDPESFFQKYFFNQDLSKVISDYERVLKFSLGVEKPDSSHLVALHEMGYLPIEIKAIEEGTVVPIKTPIATIENTHPDFAWLTNYLETLMSCELWLPTTSATTAHVYREILDEAAKETGDPAFVPFQGHDFSMRGMSSLDSAAASGAGHLLSFVGSDTIPAIHFLEAYYNANIEKELVACSVSATEHSVMSAHGRDEFETYRYLVTEVYPKGIVSIVSDTWDLWKVLDEVVRGLKQEILARDGKVVIRPDTGDPVEILCGDPRSRNPLEAKGVVEVLWDIFGGRINDKGYKELDPHIGCIYGDAITIGRCKEICKRLKEKGFASTNVVYGIGSYTYQYVTRDTFGFAVKSTHVRINGQEHNIYKDPATDKEKFKKSLTGRVAVLREGNDIKVLDQLTLAQEQDIYGDLLKVTYVNGSLFYDDSLAEIRERLRSFQG